MIDYDILWYVIKAFIVINIIGFALAFLIVY